MVLFITEQGSRIVKRGRVLMVYKDRQRLFMFPLENITQLVVMGRVEISTAMLGLLMRSGVDTVLLTRDGRFKGRISGEVSKNIFVREVQFRRRQEADFCLQVSRQLINAKLHNTANLLRRHHPVVYQDCRKRLINARRSVAATTTLAALRGLEGSLGAYYFSLFPRLIKGPFQFRKRIKHPPTDPVNILLSFGYTLLFNTLYALVETTGLDPYAGFFHQSSYGHPALVSDLMEPYRAPVIDRLVLQLINRGEISPQAFYREEEKLRLQEEAVKQFVTAYQQRLFARHMLRGKKETLWAVLQRDVWNFGKYLQGELPEYEPFIFQ